MLSRILLVLSGLLFCVQAFSQEITVRGMFLADSVKIGERIPYALSVHHPASLSVVFPDSTYSFAPFELEGKKYFPTQTRNGVSRDSALYFLSTYEIDSVQWLRLPVFRVQQGDCTVVFPSADTVFIKRLVTVVPESVEAKNLPLKTNADYLNVRWLLNYPLLLIAGSILLAILIIVWVVFGKRIRRYYRLRRMTRNHQLFLTRFDQHQQKLRTKASPGEAELTLVDWKKYIETLMGLPFTKLTTKEIMRQAPDDSLGSALHDIDKMVYAQDAATSVDAFDRLKTFSQEQFAKKAEEVKHG